MELEGDVQGRQDQAQKIIEMPQRDRETSTSENQPSSASVVSFLGFVFSFPITEKGS